MTEKELTIKAGEELDARLAEAKKTGNLVVPNATEDESVIRETFKKGEGILRLFPAFVPRRFGKAGRRLKLHPAWQEVRSQSAGFLPPSQHRTASWRRQTRVWLTYVWTMTATRSFLCAQP